MPTLEWIKCIFWLYVFVHNGLQPVVCFGVVLLLRYCFNCVTDEIN